MPDMPERVDSAQAAFGQAEQPVDSTAAAFAGASATTPIGEPGQRVPIRWGNKIGSVPVENYQKAVETLGAVPLTQDEWEEHLAKRAADAQAEIDQKQFGDIHSQLETAGVAALKQVYVIGPGILASASPETKERFRRETEVNPVSAGVGTALGIGLPILASGGAAALEEGGAQLAGRAAGAGVAGAGEELAGRALVGGVEEAAAARAAGSPVVQAAEQGAQATRAVQTQQAVRTAAQQGVSAVQGAARVVSAPANAVMHIGEKVEQWVASQLPEQATTLAGRLGLKAAALGARGAAEGVVVAENDQLSEQALSADPEFDAEKILAAVGMGTILGGATGGLFGAGGELGTAAIGKASHLLSKLSDDQIFRSVFGKGRTAMDARAVEKMEGGWRGVAQALKDRGLVQATDSIEEIANRLAPALEESGARGGALRDTLDAAGIQGPRIGKIVEGLDTGVLDGLLKSANLDASQIARLQDIKKDMASWAEKGARPVVDTLADASVFLKTRAGKDFVSRLSAEDSAKLKAGELIPALKKAAEIEGAHLTFGEAAAFRKKIDGEINWNWQANGGKLDKTGEMFKKTRSIIEDELTKAAEDGALAAKGKLGPAGEPLVPADWVKQYKDWKLEYQRLKVATRAATRGALAKRTGAQAGLAGYAGLLGGSVLGAAHGHLPGALMGLAGAVAAKQIKERGASTAGVLLDKLATLGAVQKVAASGDRQIARGARAVMKGTQVATKAPTHGLNDFEAKRDAVLDAEKDPAGHLASIQRAAAGLAQHAPATASAFVSAAVRSTNYLSTVLPRGRPLNPLMPHAGSLEPSEHEKYVFGKVADVVDNPHAMVDAVTNGTLIPQQVAAFQATSPKHADAFNKALIAHFAKATEPPPLAKQLVLSMATGKAAGPNYTQQATAMLQSNFAAPPKDGKEKTPSSALPGRAIPNASKLSLAKQTSLSPSSLAP